MTWQAAVGTIAVLVVAALLALILTGWMRTQDHEISRRPLRAAIRPRSIGCLPIAFAAAIGWKLAFAAPSWWLVPLGVLVGLGALVTLAFTVWGLRFDLERSPATPPGNEPTGAQ